MIVYHQAGRESAPRLAVDMDMPCLPASSALQMDERPDVLIRWGSSASVRFKPTHGTINRRWALSRYSDRGEQLRILKDEGVSVPEFIEGRFRSIPKRWAHYYGRNNILGRQPTGGRGLNQYAHTGFYLDSDHDLSVKAIYKLRQFRVHVIGGYSRTRELISEATYPALGIWNFDNGFTYRVPVNDMPRGVITQAIASVSALRLDFGAVDVVYGHNTELRQGPAKAYVLEVNTAPGLCDETRQWYASRLSTLVSNLRTLNPMENNQDV